MTLDPISTLTINFELQPGEQLKGSYIETDK